jgi:hypothetical protein
MSDKAKELKAKDTVLTNQERILTLLKDISKQISNVADQVKDISNNEIKLDKPKS